MRRKKFDSRKCVSFHSQSGNRAAKRMWSSKFLPRRGSPYSRVGVSERQSTIILSFAENYACMQSALRHHRMVVSISDLELHLLMAKNNPACILSTLHSDWR